MEERLCINLLTIHVDRDRSLERSGSISSFILIFFVYNLTNILVFNRQ